MEQNKYPRQTGFHSGKSFSQKLIFPAILRNWYWFALAAIMGLGLALLYNKVFPGSFKSTMTVLLINAPHQSPLSSTLDNLDIKESPVNIQDEQTVVSAYSLQLKTLENLNWKTIWYKKSFIGKKDLYKNEPFEVIFNDDSVLHAIPLKVHPISPAAFTIECDYHDKQADTQRVIRFNEKAYYGKPFANNWFHFTIYPAGSAVPADGSDYLLVFNNLEYLALEYQMALDVKIPAPESNVLNVELKGGNVQRNVDYLNELGNTYLKFGLDQKNQSAINTLSFIRREISGVADSLRTSGDRYTNFRTQNRVVDLNQEGNLVLQKVEDVDKQESILKLKIDYY